MGSVLSYVKDKDLKQELNTQFRERFAHLLTLDLLSWLALPSYLITQKTFNPNSPVHFGCFIVWSNWVFESKLRNLELNVEVEEITQILIYLSDIKQIFQYRLVSLLNI